MKRCRSLLLVWVLLLGLLAFPVSAQDAEETIPESLKPWLKWIQAETPFREAPVPFNAPQFPIAIWPSSLDISATSGQGAEWSLQVRAFSPAWLALPGDKSCWPQQVQVNSQWVPVTEKDGLPALQLKPGTYLVTGRFLWTQVPEKIQIPSTIGILNLSLDGQPQSIPNWDAEGWLWLKRTPADETEKDQLKLKIYRLVEDGLPLWLRTELDVTVSGKSREEDLGFILPDGWQLSYINSPLPIACDESGKAKIQVRAGTWKIHVDAFRNQDFQQLAYSAERPPVVERELLALRSDPKFRVTEFQGAAPVDVNLTTFPSAWRDYPVFEWTTSQPLIWNVKASGTGLPQPNQFQITRELWLDDSGQGLTFEDQIRGDTRSVSRLDIAPGHELATVRVDGNRQLITQNPASGTQGIELRTRNPEVVAIGRVPQSTPLLATGWETNAESLSLTLQLPPGWRALALFGADRVDGDWLTAWSLLDLFLLLVFSLAVFRLRGWGPGLLAFFAFGLAYHEFGAPRYTWLFLLFPVAILHVVREGRLVRWLQVWQYLALGLLLVFLVPFVTFQIQNALYPQLEPRGIQYSKRDPWILPESAPPSRFETKSIDDFNRADMTSSLGKPGAPSIGTGGLQDNRAPAKNLGDLANLQFDPGTSIQTGIAKPEWQAIRVECYWDGPVSRSQTIRPVLLSAWQHRILTVVRVVLLGLLVGFFVKRPAPLPKQARNSSSIPGAPSIAGAVALVMWCSGATVSAQEFPDRDLLNELRERMSKPAEAFPQAAEIPVASLNLADGKLNLEAEVHAAVDCAIPIPGQLPSWSPLTVRLDNSAAMVCRAREGFLWVFVPQGVHQLSVEGLIGEPSEWIWTFALTPRQLQVRAPEWNITGLGPNRRPDNQLFFSRKVRTTEGEASYDQKNFRAIVQVERTLELGLVWKVHTTVRRLSATGKAITLQVPLVEGERVVSGSVSSQQGSVEVNLAADAKELTWESDLELRPGIRLVAQNQPQMVESWRLITSPVWNVVGTGKDPIYEQGGRDLIPAWYPWPGESLDLTVSRPQAIPGKTLTVQDVDIEMDLGNRQRTHRLRVGIETSLGGEFPLQLPSQASVREIMVAGKPIPIRREGDHYLVGLQPGRQELMVDWTTDEALTRSVRFPEITLPVEAANIDYRLNIPESQWILWAQGPVRGPAVRWWVIVIVACLVAWQLGRVRGSPLKRYEWVLLAIGLTQVHFLAGLLVVSWLFLIVIRGRQDPNAAHWFVFDLFQLLLIVLTATSLGILVFVVSRGLLGNPQMFIAGQDSYWNFLQWHEPTGSTSSSRPWVISVSIWYYRFLMLAWALWLANAVITWLKIGWQNFTLGGGWRRRKQITVSP